MLPQTISPQQLAERVGPGAIVLDVDGTLAPLRLDPRAVRLSKALQKALARLAVQRPVALVSGRPLAFLQSITPDLPLILVGSHGAEANRPGLRPGKLPAFPALLRTWVRRARSQGVTVEKKPHGIVLHFRNRPPAEREAMKDRWEAELAPGLPLEWELILGNAVVEIRPRGVNKGSAIGPIRISAAGAIGAVLGDDVTDEDMFLALRPGEVGVLVGERRASLAHFHFANVTGVRHFLEALSRVMR